MTQQEIDQHLSDMSDAELRAAIETVKTDLAEAAADAPNSERHGECFAAAILYAQEASRRGLILATIH